MAKKQSSKSAKQSGRRSQSGATNNSPEPQVAQTTGADQAEPRSLGPISSVEIGHVAGEVWGVLSRDGELTLAALKKEVDAPGDMVVAALGWLAREDKLEFSTAGRSIKVSLR